MGAYAAVERARDWLGWSAQSRLTDGVASAFAWAAKRQQILGLPLTDARALSDTRALSDARARACRRAER